MKTAGALVLASALVLGLAGCSISASPSVPASNIAHTGALALQKEVGTASPPKVDCGTADIDLKVGKKIHCDVTDPSTKQVFDSVVTITKVSGLKYSIDIKVASTPKK
jgi:uncharacterized lipoprotein